MQKIIIMIVTLGFILNINAQNTELKKVISNEKIKDFTVSVYKSSDDLEGIFLIKNNKTNKEQIFKVNTFFNELKSAKDQLKFEDFNFDGKDELLILDGAPLSGPSGFYIYDYNNLEPLNLFIGKFEYENKEESQNSNFVYTYRGDYVINKEEKTIKFSGSSGAMSGMEETYKFIDVNDDNYSNEEKGRFKLVERREWNW